MNFLHALAGSLLASEQTYPLLISLTDTPLILKPTLLPGLASDNSSWCCSIDLTSVYTPPGANLTVIPGFNTPVSTLPTGTVPTPEILYTSYNGSLNGLSSGLVGFGKASIASIKQGPLYQDILVDLVVKFSPSIPEKGTYWMFCFLNPVFFKKLAASFLISLYLPGLY